MRRNPNPPVSECPDNGEGHQRDEPPGDVHAETDPQHVRDQIAKETGGPGRPQQVIDQVTPCGHETDTAPQAASGKGVVPSARGHVLGKLRHRISDEEADDSSQKE